MKKPRPSPDDAALDARTERQLARLRELTETRMAMARDLGREAVEGSASGRSIVEIADAFTRIASEVLQIQARQARLMAGGGRRIAREAARELAARPVDASIH